jgi:hypothetical protein
MECGFTRAYTLRKTWNLLGISIFLKKFQEFQEFERKRISGFLKKKGSLGISGIF